MWCISSVQWYEIFSTFPYFPQERYPVNTLRNIAATHARTELVFHADVDFIPNNKMFQRLSAYGYELLEYTRDDGLLVVPAFEVDSNNGTNDYLFLNYRQIFHLINDPCCTFKRITKLDRFVSNNILWFIGLYTTYVNVHPPSHAAVDYPRWYTSHDIYQIDYQNWFEPYVIAPRELPIK
jgi:glycosyltransferase-like protein LARGE